MGRFFWGLFLSAFAAPLSQAIQLNSSILLFNDRDYAECPLQVEKAALLGNDTLSFVPTFYFTRPTELSNQLEAYCRASDHRECHPLDVVYLGQVKRQLQNCFRRTLELGMKITILMHVDDAVRGYWRNNLVFDPLQNYEGYSYKSVALDTVAVALKNAADEHLRYHQPALPLIHFALAGEMGSSVFEFPESYLNILNEMKVTFGPVAKIGINYNHDVIGGGGRRYSRKKLRVVQDLFEASDFVGISAYTPLDARQLSPQSFSKNISFFKSQLRREYGLTLGRRQEVHFSETGLGGGSAANNNSAPAQDSIEAAAHPYSGLGGEYSRLLDPWLNLDLQNFRCKFHRMLLDYLDGGDPQQPLTQAFLWNAASWDAQGLYPGSAVYADEEIIQMIREHNTRQ